MPQRGGRTALLVSHLKSCLGSSVGTQVAYRMLKISPPARPQAPKESPRDSLRSEHRLRSSVSLYRVSAPQISCPIQATVTAAFFHATPRPPSSELAHIDRQESLWGGFPSLDRATRPLGRKGQSTSAECPCRSWPVVGKTGRVASIYSSCGLLHSQKAETSLERGTSLTNPPSTKTEEGLSVRETDSAVNPVTCIGLFQAA